MVPTTQTTDWDMSRVHGSEPIGVAATPPGPPTYMDDELKATRAGDALEIDPVLGPIPAHRHFDPGTAQSVVLEHDEEIRYLQIFTGAIASFPDTPIDAVVLEPLSAMSDAYNNHDGLHVISPGETYQTTIAIRVETEGWKSS